MHDPFEALLEELVPGAGQRATAPVDAPELPRELGLEPLELVGRGGTGWVYRARDPVLEREVAVKIARADLGAAGRDALLEEARRTASFAHPSVLPVHRVVVAGGQLCLEIRLAPKVTLEAMLADPELMEGRDTPARLALLRGPVRALRRGHERGLVHGDVHPGNLMHDVDDTVYLVDWSGPGEGAAGTFTGSPGHAAPEVLAGARPTAASDVYGLGVVCWELVAGRAMRPRRRGEELGAFLARWRDRPTPPLPPGPPLPAGLSALLDAALHPDPGARATAATFDDLLDDTLSGEAERKARRDRGAGLLERARQALSRYHELGRRLEDERQVVAIQSARVPSHAPEAAKAALWEAEDRLAELELRRGKMWLEAVEQSTLAGAMGAEEREARDIVAELWWIRMEDMAARNLEREESFAAYQVAKYDPDRRGAVLRAPCRLSMDSTRSGTPAALRATLSRWVPEGRRLVPKVVATLPMPLDGQVLEPGSWLVTVEGEGLAPLPYPVLLSRGEHHHGSVCPRTPDEVGDGWVQVPAGAFVFGGDEHARRPMPRCRPTLGERFVRRTAVTSAEWLAFLRDLPPDEARRRAPGVVSPVGEVTRWWREGDAGWALPDAWDPRWPVVGVDADDAGAFAAWMSARSGRPQRLPTEEEWEKAARGVDARIYPWGDRFDALFAHMRAARPGPPRLGPVGEFPVDRSPYGALDMAGLVREWTASWIDHELVVVRGGSWSDEAGDLRCATRFACAAGWRSALVGFRLVSEVPAPRSGGPDGEPRTRER